MGRTPDRRPGALIEDDEILIADSGVDPSVQGGISFSGGSFRLFDGLGVFNPRSGAATVFGEAYTEASVEAQSDTTHSNFQELFTLTTPSLNAGTYVVLWYLEVRASVGGKTVEAQVLLDGSSVLALPSSTPDKDIWVPMSGAKALSLASGVHTLKLSWRLNGNTATVSARRSRMMIWRTT